MHEQYPNVETQLTPQEVLQAGTEFLQHFGVEPDPQTDPDLFLQAISQLDPRYKEGRDLVRWQLEADQTKWPEQTIAIVNRAAEKMRMHEIETPLIGEFDTVIVLGGARQANLDRALYAAKAAASGQASFKELIVAGSIRELNEAEQENVANYAPGAKTEADLCTAAAQAVRQEYPDLSISVFSVDDPKVGTPAVIEKVLSSLDARGSLSNSRVAAVTTQIYQASTELDLARVAKEHGITETYTAGNPSDPKVIEARTTATYLAEVIRDLRAATLALHS